MILYPVPPEPTDVIRDLAGITPLIYRGLEAGSDEARRWFKARGQVPEPYHFASTVRCVAKDVLRTAGIRAEIEVDSLPNNGLSLAYHQYSVRIRKEAPAGGLPAPGPSLVLQSFYNQTFGWTDDAAEQINLLVLWKVTPDWVLQTPLALVCPKGPASETSCDKHWQEPLPNPVYDAQPSIDESEADDLDITRPEEETGS